MAARREPSAAIQGRGCRGRGSERAVGIAGEMRVGRGEMADATADRAGVDGRVSR
jgi:hypothetical protein